MTGDGCDSTCTVETGWSCTTGNTTTASTCADICGDGITINLNDSSYCDDGNNVGGDGCSSTCTVERGYSCTGGSLSSADQCVYVRRTLSNLSGYEQVVARSVTSFALLIIIIDLLSALFTKSPQL